MTDFKHILITGGAGFIGSHLCEYHLQAGCHVIAMDNLVTGSEANINRLQQHFPRAFEFILHDVTNYIHVPGPLDAIFHLASPASPVDYLKLPIQTLKVGGLGTHNALGLAMAKNARILLASTSEVYGDPLQHPQREDYWGNVNQIGPRGVYDEAKRFAEAITMAYHRTNGVDTRIIRIFNTYGPRMRLHDGRVVPTFIYQALTNRPITVFGEGNQSRSFTYITDLIDGMVRLMNCNDSMPCNIGNPNETTVLEFARLVIEMTDSSSTIIRQPLPEDDPKVRRPDITRARQILGWEPQVHLREGLERTIAWFREQSLEAPLS